MTELSPAPRLTRIARMGRALFGLSVLSTVAGAAITIHQAPCSRNGPYFLLPPIALAAVAAIAFLVHAFLIRSWKEAWRSFEVPMLVALGAWCFSFVITMLLCPGV
jgi:hypothetical protein